MASAGGILTARRTAENAPNTPDATVIAVALITMAGERW
jgi:hypothetical protein